MTTWRRWRLPCSADWSGHPEAHWRSARLRSVIRQLGHGPSDGRAISAKRWVARIVQWPGRLPGWGCQPRRCGLYWRQAKCRMDSTGLFLDLNTGLGNQSLCLAFGATRPTHRHEGMSWQARGSVPKTNPGVSRQRQEHPPTPCTPTSGTARRWRASQPSNHSKGQKRTSADQPSVAQVANMSFPRFGPLRLLSVFPRVMTAWIPAAWCRIRPTAQSAPRLSSPCGLPLYAAAPNAPPT